ncbi:MAG: sulfatase/phosphatase domain-containing protein, partial [Acidobacteriota bacterium]
FDRWVSFKGQGVYYNPTFNVDGKPVEREGYVTDLITEYAVDFLTEERNRPFMLYVSHKAVHFEFAPARRHQGTYSGRKYRYPDSMANTEANYRGKPAWVKAQRQSWHGVDGMFDGRVGDFDQFAIEYAETMRAVDESVGRIVDALRERDLLGSTLILYTSDNGFLFGEHGLVDKRAMYEASIRVPLIAHCPDLFEGGQRRPEMILNIDFAPTFLETAARPVPDSMQGRSFYGLLTGASAEWRKAFLYEYFWERAFPQTPTVLGVRSERYKFMKYHGVWDRYELYDLQADPEERHNLLGEIMHKNEWGPLDRLIRMQADPELRDVYEEMEAHLTRLLEESGAAAEPNWSRLQ